MKDNIKFIIEVITFFMTYIAIVFTFLTLKEMKEQRIQSSMPDIVVNSINLQAYINDQFGLKYFFQVLPNSRDFMDKQITDNQKFIETEDIDEYEKVFNYEYQDPFINVYNIGLGTAKDIEFNWFFSTDEILDTLNSVGEFGIKNIENGIKIKKMRETYSLYLNNSNEYSEYKEFLIPIESYEQYFSLKIPKDYLNTIVYISNISTELDIPPLKLEIKYKGIEGKTYRKNYIFYVNDKIVLKPKSYFYHGYPMIIMSEFKVELVEN